MDWLAITETIRLLPNTTVDNLSIEIMKTDKESRFNYNIFHIIALKTIRRLSLANSIEQNQLFHLIDNSSRIEYLTNSGVSCGFQDLEYIFRCRSHLKYLNIQVTSKLHFGYHHLLNFSTDNIISMPTLRTLILSFEEDDLTTFGMLAQQLKMLPALHRLEIKAHDRILNANDWEDLLQISLPLLTHFQLKTTTARIRKENIENKLTSFETPFWIEKTNFYLIITEHKYLDSNRFCLDRFNGNDQDEFNQPVVQWWIAPLRARIDDIPTKDIISFGISRAAGSLSEYYYFKNVKHLVIYNLDDNLLEWLLTYVNYSRIEYLDVSLLHHESTTIISFLSSVRNITYLRISYNRLLLYQNAYLKQDHGLKYLDISVDEHPFDQGDLINISQLFPNLEHLAINTTEFSNIPLLKTYFPHLCSLTFAAICDQFLSSKNSKKKHWDPLQQQVQFFFHHNDKWITVWIDQAVLEDPYWRKFSSNVSAISTTSKSPFPPE
jgi:hypothetical protein